jgi:hypothetical protein
MIIMQTSDAAARRSFIESRGLAKVIYSHEHDDAVCIQYHPKGIPGANPLIHPTSRKRRTGVPNACYSVFKAA